MAKLTRSCASFSKLAPTSNIKTDFPFLMVGIKGIKAGWEIPGISPTIKWHAAKKAAVDPPKRNASTFWSRNNSAARTIELSGLRRTSIKPSVIKITSVVAKISYLVASNFSLVAAVWISLSLPTRTNVTSWYFFIKIFKAPIIRSIPKSVPIISIAILLIN